MYVWRCVDCCGQPCGVTLMASCLVTLCILCHSDIVLGNGHVLGVVNGGGMGWEGQCSWDWE